MGWATFAIEKLKQGQTITIRPRGNSMSGKIDSGQAVVIEPTPANISIGDIVLCKVRGQEYLHLVKATRDGQYLIGNNHGKINGWITISNIFGRFIGFAK
jgi:hypothetical protein